MNEKFLEDCLTATMKTETIATAKMVYQTIGLQRWIPFRNAWTEKASTCSAQNFATS